jgi:hypothetical protein
MKPLTRLSAGDRSIILRASLSAVDGGLRYIAGILLEYVARDTAG